MSRGRSAASAVLAALACAGFAPLPPAAPAPAGATSERSASFQLIGRLRQGALVQGFAPPGTTALTLDGKPVPVEAGGRFIIGFDRDQPAGAQLVAARGDAPPIVQALTVQPRSWPIEKIDVARRPEGPTEAYLRLRQQEQARIEAARSLASATDGWVQRFIMPAHGRISGQFGAQRIYRGEPAAFHSGLDIAAGAGAVVVAPADGVVVLAGPPAFSLEGNLVIIDHGMGLNSAFLHLATEDVQVGQKVRQGDRIGTVGATGRATGPHLHWSVKWREARLDPQGLVAEPGS
ncbi:MAG: M23 family metallopeptidase [Sphingomonadales bacterium]